MQKLVAHFLHSGAVFADFCWFRCAETLFLQEAARFVSVTLPPRLVVATPPHPWPMPYPGCSSALTSSKVMLTDTALFMSANPRPDCHSSPATCIPPMHERPMRQWLVCCRRVTRHTYACSQAIAGGHTTRDLGKTLSKTQMGDSMTKPFTEEVVSYKHGDNIILHQWADTGDLLVNCQSPTPQSFICQVRPRRLPRAMHGPRSIMHAVGLRLAQQSHEEPMRRSCAIVFESLCRRSSSPPGCAALDTPREIRSFLSPPLCSSLISLIGPIFLLGCQFAPGGWVDCSSGLLTRNSRGRGSHHLAPSTAG